ncbi:Domain of uncharacterised function (DUF3560) [Mycobacteroides abscessus subsp. abscessus]|uniref:DUF3560 domain-containing protein n=1 Tax=Mycobacteroides abscessus TaxID=36809 RepID=UPI0009286E43|nr:DUF3560 domain-containing protein [Mycobacteroides abscessus]SIJ22648.1 Domain of uncharacterised function (DUF3560) [Mycobacteroides abscessus subsp. abscessus]SLH38109.1 Domain of uncharacterised function (DUF3560) [Mycobacteroides abscessus subsp. abscessus]
MLTISHSQAEGTLISGTSRGDGSAEILKNTVNPRTGHGRAWRWSRNLGTWYVQRSRDTRANTALIEATKRALEGQGFTVAVEIDDTYRSAGEAEADKVIRQEDRVSALSAKAERKSVAAEGAWAAEARAVEALPPGGEPIKVGHHSERRHRRAIERAHDATRRAIDATNEASAVADRVKAAAQTTEFRYSPAVIRRRIGRLEADLRRFERARDGYTRTVFRDSRGIKHVETHAAATGAYRERVLGEIDRLNDQIAYWQAELGNAAAAGAQLWSADTVQVGDRIRYWTSEWDTVSRVNPKTVGLTERRGRLPYDQIQAVEDSQGQKICIVDGARTIGDTAG